MIKKIIGYGSLVAVMIGAPLGYGVYLINGKFKQLDISLESIKKDLNATQKVAANYQLNRGLFNSSGFYSIKLNDEQKTEIKVDFSIRHGVEVVFNTPITISTNVFVKSPAVEVNGPLIISKTRYYPYYADTEYKFSPFTFNHQSGENEKISFKTSSLKGNAKYTFKSTDLENYLSINDFELIKNGETTKYEGFSKQSKFRADNLAVGSWFFKINKITNPEYTANNLSFNFVSEKNPQNEATYNFAASIDSGLDRPKLGESKINAKVSFNAIKSDAVNEITKDFLKMNFAKNDNNQYETNIANQIINILGYGLGFDSNINIETKKLGSFTNSLYGKMSTSDENGVSVNRQLSASGNFTHKGVYVDFFYELFNKLGFPLVKGKSEIFSVNYSAADGKSMINTIEIQPEYHFPALKGVYEQIIE